MATTILNSTFYKPYNTGQYKRILNYYKNAPNGSVDWAYIAPSGTSNTNLGNVNAIAYNNGVAYTSPVGMISDNTLSGITFFVFNKNQLFKDITLLVGPNATDSASSYADGADSIYISTASTNQPIAFVSNTIVTGDTSTSPSSDNDLVVFGSDSSLDPTNNSPNSYPISVQDSAGNSLYQGTINYLTGGIDALQLTVKGNSVKTGNGADSLIFANVTASSRIGGDVAGDANVFDLGQGADFIYFANPAQIAGQNTINIGNPGGTPDAQSDTVIFNYNSQRGVGSDLTGLNGNTSFLVIQGFKDGQDRLYYNGQFYTQASAITTATSNRIKFS